ncbi:hypothetical protein GQ44DRAFT_39024 [Phaeosphaeriaceae sp. PMI808]|nr:hypothetical protein GQ44DRAFT_39024 [Phaeosphaeriaceae sp. PMI808]
MRVSYSITYHTVSISRQHQPRNSAGSTHIMFLFLRTMSCYQAEILEHEIHRVYCRGVFAFNWRQTDGLNSSVLAATRADGRATRHFQSLHDNSQVTIQSLYSCTYQNHLIQHVFPGSGNARYILLCEIRHCGCLIGRWRIAQTTTLLGKTDCQQKQRS